MIVKTHFRLVENMGTQSPMNLINVSELIFISMWLAIPHFKDYKIGFSVKNIFSMKTNELSEKNRNFLAEAERRTAANPDVSTTMTNHFAAFYLRQRPPRVPVPRTRVYICQRRDSTNYQYSSLFDTNAGIPVYSGYIISRNQGLRIGTYRRCTATWKRTPGSK